MFISNVMRLWADLSGTGNELAARFVKEFGCDPTPTKDRRAYHAARRRLSKVAQEALDIFKEEDRLGTCVRNTSGDLKRFYQFELKKVKPQARYAKNCFWSLHNLASANGIETPASIKEHELTWR